MSYTKNRVEFHYDHWKSPSLYRIQGWLENEQKERICGAELEVEDLRGTFKTTVKTDDVGAFEVEINIGAGRLGKDHNYLIRIAYMGDDKNFGKEIKIPVVAERDPSIIEIVNPQKEYKPGDVIKINLRSEYDNSSVPAVNERYLNCVFNGIHSVMIIRDRDGYFEFRVPNTNVDNRNCKLVLNFEGSDSYLASRLEFVFDIIVVKKIKYKKSSNKKSSGEVQFIDIYGKPLTGWVCPYPLVVYTKYGGEDEERWKRVSVRNVWEDYRDPWYKLKYVIGSSPEKPINTRKEYSYVIYKGLISNKEYGD